MNRPFSFRPSVEHLELRAVPALLRSIPDDAVVSAPDDGGLPRVKVIDPTTGEDVGEFEPYAQAFRGGVRAALGDITGDGVKDLVVAAGPGGGPHVRAFNGATGAELFSFFAYDVGFHGGVNVAVGDVNGDGHADIITGAGAGGGPHVKVFDGATGQTLRSFFAYAPVFTGGVNVASGDINRDGHDDILVGAGQGGGPHVYVRSGKDDTVLTQFFAYDVSFRGGVNVGSGDVDGDGYDDILTGAGAGGGPHVRGISGRTGGELISQMADSVTFSRGVRVTAADANHDGIDDLVALTRHGADVSASVFQPAGWSSLGTFIRKVDDHPSAEDLIAGQSENRGGGTSTGGTGGSTTDSGVTRVEGPVVAVNVAGRAVTLRRGTSNVVVSLTSTAKIERNDIETTLAAFKVGDFGQARLGADGLAFKVEAVGP